MAEIRVDGQKYHTSSNSKCENGLPSGCLFTGGGVDLQKLPESWININSSATHQVSCPVCQRSFYVKKG